MAGSILSIVLTMLLLPAGESDDEDDKTPQSPFKRTASKAKLLDGDTRTQSADGIHGISKVFSMVWLLLSTKVVTSLANAISASAMPLILKDTYRMNEVNHIIYI